MKKGFTLTPKPRKVYAQGKYRQVNIPPLFFQMTGIDQEAELQADLTLVDGKLVVEISPVPVA